MRSGLFLVLCLAALAPAGASAQTVPPIVGAPASTPETPRAELLRQAREARQDIVQPYRPSTLERWISRIEPYLMTPPVKRTTFRQGVYPKFGGVAPGSGWALGPGYRHEGLAGGVVDADVFARMSWKRYWQVEGRLEMPRLNDGRTTAGAFARLRDLPQEDFFGFGPESVRDDRVSFGLREFAGGVFAGQRLAEGLSLEAAAEYVRADTRAGSDEHYPSIEEVFDTTALPGFGDRPAFAVLRAGAVFDRTDQPGNPRRGPRYRAEVSRWQSQDAGRLNFTAISADVQQFISFFHDTRVIALRAAVWHTEPSSGSAVPLYYQPTLGGSRTLRGYRQFRFRDRSALVLQAEYRYHLFPGGNGVVFYEAGTVGPSLGEMGSLKSDYGLGVRFGTAGGVFLRIEAAFGTVESPRFYVKLSDVF